MDKKYIREYLDEMEHIPAAYLLLNAENNCRTMLRGLGKWNLEILSALVAFF